MPELAEVETVRRVLLEDLVGLTITKVDLLYPAIFENKEEVNNLIGNKITDIKRVGKYLIFGLEKGFLLSHLRMEGKYFYLDEDASLNKHMHVVFHFDNGKILIYQDVRKFGRMHYYQTYANLENDLDLGPDCNVALPFIDKLYAKLKRSRKPIKTLLLDQSFIAGLGNIYVDEVLYASKIDPEVEASKLDYNDLKNILEASKSILDLAIINKGTTIRSYTSSLGVTGNYQNYLKVHTKEVCPLGHKVYKKKIGGRTSYFCPVCQDIRKSYVVGITGGIATGKTNVSNTLKNLGFNVFDADVVAHEAYNDSVVIAKLKEAFPEMKNDVDKNIIANIIFKDETRRKILNEIIHPYVIAKLEEEIQTNSLLFVDIPLLYECNLDRFCDKVIVCYVDYDIEVERVMHRDKVSLDEARLRIASQMSLELKKNRADYIINTEKTFAETKARILEVLEEVINGISL